MKKNFLLLLMLMLMLIIMVSVTYGYLIEDGGTTCTVHEWQTYYTKVNDTNHVIKCKKCGSYKAGTLKKHYTSLEADKATCTTKAICAVCQQEYGNYSNHVYDITYTNVDGVYHEQRCKWYDKCGMAKNREKHTFYPTTHICTNKDCKFIPPEQVGNFHHRFDSNFKCIYNGCGEILSVRQESEYYGLTPKTGYKPYPNDSPTLVSGSLVVKFNNKPIDENGKNMPITLSFQRYYPQWETWHILYSSEDPYTPSFKNWYDTLSSMGKLGGTTSKTITNGKDSVNFSAPTSPGRYFITLTVNGKSLGINRRIAVGSIPAPAQPTGKVWVVGREATTGNILYGVDKEDVTIQKGGTTKTYTAKDLEYYNLLGYTVEYDTVSSLKPTLSPTNSGNNAQVQITSTQDEILITFIYNMKPSVPLSILHIDEATGSIIPGSPVYNMDLNNLLNIYEISDQSFINEYLKITLGSGTTTEKVIGALDKIKSYWNEGNEQKLKSLRLDTSQFSEYNNLYTKIGSLKITKTTSGQAINSKDRYTPLLDGSIAAMTISGATVPINFYYYKPKPILCIAKSLPTYESQSAGIPEWIAGAEGKIKITNKGVHYQLSSAGSINYNKINAREIEVKFPFDIYYKGNLYKADTWIEVLDKSTITDENIIAFTLPSWVEAKEYNNIYIRTVAESAPASVGSDLGQAGANDLTANYSDPKVHIAYTTTSVVIIDKVYDFTISYLEGDSSWQASLFGNPGIEEYKADRLPIGQKQNMPEKYGYGIKLGSPFLYSVNTIGEKNDGIIIEPKVLYIPKDGSKVEEVDIYYYLANKKLVKMSDGLEAPLTTVLNKQTRLDNHNNIMKELVDAKRIYNIYDYNKLREIGKYAKIILLESLRLPYSNYLFEVPGGVGLGDDLLKTASHWYGEYKLPSSTLAAKKGTVITGAVNENSPMFSPYKDGYLLVCFKITTTKNAAANPITTYLTYGQNQWKIEGYNLVTKRITLPTQTGTIQVSMPAGYEEYCPVALYQAGVRLNSDFESAGTH